MSFRCGGMEGFGKIRTSATDSFRVLLVGCEAVYWIEAINRALSSMNVNKK